MSRKSDRASPFTGAGSTELRPRVILKTHSGVRRPGIFSVLVARCTSATQPSDQATVAKRLAAEFKGVARDTLKGATLGERGAAFHVVWMARPQQLGFLTSNLFWSWKGHVIRALTPCDSDDDANAFLELSTEERVIYLKYYLEGDGAILMSFARELLSRGSLTEEDLVRTDLLERNLEGIWKEYLDLSTNITERVRLRQKLQRQPYDTSTRRHKTYPHLIPLEDLGLVVRSESKGMDIFTPAVSNGWTPLRTMAKGFPTIKDLEVSIDRGEHCTILAEAMFPGHRRFSQRDDLAPLLQATIEGYRALSIGGAVIHPIDAISDICYAQMLFRKQVLVTRRDIDSALAELQTQHPKEVRFHVDRMGRPAFVVIDDELVDNLLST